MIENTYWECLCGKWNTRTSGREFPGCCGYELYRFVRVWVYE